MRFHQLDVTNVESIRRLADYIRKTHGGLDILINNAAIAFKTNDVTPFGDQAEITAQTNFFGTINVCNALFPLLRDHARFVVVVSFVHKIDSYEELFFFLSRVVNVSSRAGMLESITNSEIRRQLTAPNATIENVSDILSDFIR